MESIQKFQDLLKRLFQFEASDLDFGIYRILNYKRERLKKFIQEDLKNKIESAFAKHKGERLTKINQRFEEVKQKVIQGLGTQVFTPAGELKEEFKHTPLGRDYLSIKAQKDEAETIDEIKLQVFNDLYNFFSRFYEEGDFVPQYRYSIKGHKYAIPYNGEEVKLYWANNEQYYTKAGLLFRDYTFRVNDYQVIFRIVSARQELGSKRATKQRFFILDDENPVEERTEDKALIIRFQYRELTEEEVIIYGVEGGSNIAKQEKINQKTCHYILGRIENITMKALLNKEYKNEKPLLLYQVSRFTAKNTKDYFIHKNLKKFLSEQLDYFVKAEVLDIETLEKERFLDKHITRAKVVREIGEDIIDFLSQIEDFQKRLWEKKKFVLKTEYVITTDRVPEELHQEIWTNKEQKNEWKDLGFEIPKTKEDLKKRTLPIDTKYYAQELKEKLLEGITSSPVIARSDSDEAISLHDLLDGILIKSENWQALNLILERYRNKMQCIYIDPPYNTGNDTFLYKDKYKDSSWLSMIIELLSLFRSLGTEDAVFFISIDDHELPRLTAILEAEFGKDSLLGPIIVQVNKGGRSYLPIAKTHEYIACGTVHHNESAIRELLKENKEEFRYKDSRGIYALRELRNRNPKFTRKNRPNLFYPFYIDPRDTDEYGNCAVSLKKTMKHTIEAVPKNKKGEDDCWRWGRDKVQRCVDSNNPNESDIVARKKSGGGWNIYEKYRKQTTKAKSIWDESSVRTENGTIMLRNLFGTPVFFDNPKPVELVEKCMKIATNADSLILDFFAGSGTTGHAVAKFNREDAGKRKYILVEMAEYFDTVIIPRLKKVCYSFNWKDGKPQDTDGISQFFKYHILEQYEDTLDNIELTASKQAELKFGDDYLLKYFLDYETRGNPSFLNIDQLKNPFSYKLKVNLEEVGEPQEMVVDIPETFNYLLGLKIKKIKARDIASPSARHDKKRKYLFILGEKEGKDIAIVWREYDDNWIEEDFKEDKEFIIQELESWAPHIVYVNGQSVLTPKLGDYGVEIRYIEPEFKRLMEA